MHQDLHLYKPNQVSGEEMPCLQGANSRLITGSEDAGWVVIYKSRNSLRSSSPWLSQAQLNWSKVWNRVEWRLLENLLNRQNSQWQCDTGPTTLALFQEETGREAFLWGWARDGHFLVVQWQGGPLHGLSAGGPGVTTGQGTRSHTTQLRGVRAATKIKSPACCN